MKDIELLILHYLLYAPDSVKEFLSEGIDDTFFSNQSNQSVARIIFDYFKTYTSPISSQALSMKLEQLQTPAAVAEAYAKFDSEELAGLEAKWLIEELRNHKKKSILEDGLQEAVINVRGTDPMAAEQTLQKIIDQLVKTSTNNKQVARLSDEIQSVVDTYKIPKKDKVLTSGYFEIDDVTGGYQPGWLVLVAALPKIGKTKFLVNCACNMVKKKVNVLVFSLEVAKWPYINLCTSCLTRIPYSALDKRFDPVTGSSLLTANDHEKLAQLVTDFGTNYGALHIVDTQGSISPGEVQAWITKQEQETGVKYDVIVIDYGQLMRATRSTGKDHLDQAQIAEELKAIARKNGKVVLAAVQRKNDEKAIKKASKQETEDGTGAGGESIGRSFVWYQTADVLMIIQNETPDELSIAPLRFKLISRFSPNASFTLIKDYNTTSILSVKDNPQMKGLWDDKDPG